VSAPKWIAAQAAKSRPKLSVEEALRRFEESVVSARDARTLRDAPRPKRPWLAPSPHDFPSKDRCSISTELARFSAKEPRVIWSPLLDDLLSAGLIRVTHEMTPPFRCLGFVLTDAGKLKLKRG
jgi:hypothetical protein